MVACLATGNESLDAQVNQWLSWNKNKKLEAEVLSVADKKDVNVLESWFLTRMEFGTAGLRGRMGPGNSQMNEVVIIQTAQGLLKYATSSFINLKESGLVIGYDGRYNSKLFADITTSIFIRSGVPVYLFSKVCPTPFVAFCVRKYKAAVGVMVTASHNPKEDNGYKVFWNNGVQIISPHDKEITKCIEASLEPEPDAWDTSILQGSALLKDPLEDIMKTYMEEMTRNLVNSTINSVAPVNITYTAMHGVGYPYIVEAFKAANLKAVIPVAEQIEPDPDFPTVKFPNPEEGKSALDLAIKTAEANNCSLILANDPDADRLAVAEKLSDGSWKIFTGNEIGGILAWWLIYVTKMRKPSFSYKNVYLLSSTVSSKICKTIARAEGFSFEETLTGFKWMGNRSDVLITEGKQVLFAFEEAIGFMCGSSVLDKDGISAAVNITELATYLYSRKETLAMKLQDIYEKYGHHISNNSYFFCYDSEVIKSIFERLRNHNGQPHSYPDSILDGKYKITSVRDLTTGYDSSTPDKKATLPVSSSSQMITFSFENGLVVTLRTSGTEPKVKYYSELCGSRTIRDIEALESILNEMIKAIIDEFLEPEKNGLIPRK